jgi:hypothetical protein
MVLGERTRKILFWVTAVVVGLVVVAGMISALRILIRPREETEPLGVVPPEASLCPGQVVEFSTNPAVQDVEWAATGGGEISTGGRYTAGEVPGDYEIQAAGPEGQRGRAVVHIVLCTPTPTAMPSPTPAPTPTPTTAPTPMPLADPQSDVGVYSSGALADAYPDGVDIMNASVAEDRRVALQPGEGLPQPLIGWPEEGEVLLWIALYEPIPETMEVRTDWLFALDMDGDTATGRPVGSARVNPDLGMEAAVGLYYDPTVEEFASYLLVWDPAQGAWADGPEVVRFTFSPDRTLVALALPLDTLEQQVSEVTGVAWVPEATTGRAAAVSYTEPEAVIDLYPEPAE